MVFTGYVRATLDATLQERGTSEDGSSATRRDVEGLFGRHTFEYGSDSPRTDVVGGGALSTSRPTCSHSDSRRRAPCGWVHGPEGAEQNRRHERKCREKQ